MKILIGADPEFFVSKAGTFVSGHTFNCGTKLRPMKTKHGSVQVDGLALEVNVTPSSTKVEFIANILGVIGDLNEIVATDNCKIVAQPTAVFDAAYMKSLPKKVKELGCNPDFNAYLLDMNNPPDGSVNFRTGAGHIHIGWTQDENPDDYTHMIACAELVKNMDYFVGLRTLKFDTDAQRRQLYGQAGAFRPKSYGCEYRVPSSMWLSSEALMAEVFDATMLAVEATMNKVSLDEKFNGFAQECINKNVTDWDKIAPSIAKEIQYVGRAA